MAGILTYRGQVDCPGQNGLMARSDNLKQPNQWKVEEVQKYLFI